MNPGRRISAGGVVFRPAGKTIEVALISTRGGKVWGLPKGLAEKGENLARTAHREVREETGLEGKILKNLGHIEYFFTFKHDVEEHVHLHEPPVERVFKIVYFFLMEYAGGSTEDHDTEVDEVRWFPVDEAIRLLKFDDEKGIVKKAKKELKKLGHIK
jgi:8-oxo-dGTP diphosphatase